MSSIASRVPAPGLSIRPALRQVAATIDGLVRGLDQRRLLVGMIFLVIFAFDLVRPTDIDVWWHLKAGELIARTGAVPATDPFSYAAVGRPWVAHEWLWELGVYELDRIGGYRLAVLVSALIVTLTYALLYRLLRQLGTNELVSAAIVVWAAVLAVPSVGVRPRELTLLFFSFYLSQLLLYRAGRVRHLWSLPVAMAFWVNLHGLFILGLGLLGLFTVGEVATWLFERGKPPRHLFLVSAATVAATAISPLGPKMLLYPLGYFLQADNPSFSSVTEFQSPDFHDPFYLLFAAGLLLFMVLGVARDRPNVGDTLSVVVFAIMSLVSVRNAPVFALVAAPVLATQLRDRFRWARELTPLRVSPSIVAINWLLLGGLIGLGIWYAQTPGGSQRIQLGHDPSVAKLPLAGVRLIEQQKLPGPLFNYEPWGGYLTYRWYPQTDRRVFIDGRIDMYGTAIVKEYAEVVEARPGWKRVLDKYGVQTLLIDKDSALSTLLLADGGWDRVFQGEIEDVFVRRAPR